VATVASARVAAVPASRDAAAASPALTVATVAGTAREPSGLESMLGAALLGLLGIAGASFLRRRPRSTQ
jgi:hypothetical protein